MYNYACFYVYRTEIFLKEIHIIQSTWKTQRPVIWVSEPLSHDSPSSSTWLPHQCAGSKTKLTDTNNANTPAIARPSQYRIAFWSFVWVFIRICIILNDVMRLSSDFQVGMRLSFFTPGLWRLATHVHTHNLAHLWTGRQQAAQLLWPAGGKQWFVLTQIVAIRCLLSVAVFPWFGAWWKARVLLLKTSICSPACIITDIEPSHVHKLCTCVSMLSWRTVSCNTHVNNIPNSFTLWGVDSDSKLIWRRRTSSGTAWSGAASFS